MPFILNKKCNIIHKLNLLLGVNRMNDKEIGVLHNRFVIYERLRAKFGEENQLVKALEELAELQKEICKCIYSGINTDINNLIEEIADVKIMIEQILHIYEIDPKEIQRAKVNKLIRTEKMLDELRKNEGQIELNLEDSL